MPDNVITEIRCENIATDALYPDLVDDMWQLFDSHYEGITRSVFERDLMRKQNTLLLWRAGVLAGFTSQEFRVIGGQRVVYSGDVIVRPEARDVGSASFFQQWALAVWEQCDWWCALSSGPRTFRIPHTFFKRVTPGYDLEESAKEREFRHAFSEAAYGDRYCRREGIVRLDHPYTLCEESRREGAEDTLDSYFRASNPGWIRGDELVSLVSLNRENWKPVALRMLNWKNGHG